MCPLRLAIMLNFNISKVAYWIQRDQIPVCSCKSLIKWSILIKLIKISSFYFIQYLKAKQWGNIEALFLLIFTRSHFEKFGSIEVSGYASLLKPLGKWNTFQFVICCGSKNSSKLLFSRFQLIDSCHGDSSIKGRDFTEVIILSWHRCLSFVCQCFFRFSRFLSP